MSSALVIAIREFEAYLSILGERPLSDPEREVLRALYVPTLSKCCWTRHERVLAAELGRGDHLDFGRFAGARIVVTIDWERALAVLMLGLGTWFVGGLIAAIGFGIWMRYVRGSMRPHDTFPRRQRRRKPPPFDVVMIVAMSR